MMTSYRRMRRQARQIRRSGMQPMMVVNTDPGQFPIPAGVLLARFCVALPLRTRTPRCRGRDTERRLVDTRQLAEVVGTDPARLLGQRLAYRDIRCQARTHVPH